MLYTVVDTEPLCHGFHWSLVISVWCWHVISVIISVVVILFLVVINKCKLKSVYFLMKCHIRNQNPAFTEGVSLSSWSMLFLSPYGNIRNHPIPLWPVPRGSALLALCERNPLVTFPRDLSWRKHFFSIMQCHESVSPYCTPLQPPHASVPNSLCTVLSGR